MSKTNVLFQVNGITKDIIVNGEDHINDIYINKSALGLQKKNLLKNTAKTTIHGNNTYTVNYDGSIVVNGTGNDSRINFLIGSIQCKAGDKFVLTGCPSGGSKTTYSIAYGLNDVWSEFDDIGEGLEFTIDIDGLVGFYIIIHASYAPKNLTFYPMVKYASVVDDTYEPYVEDVHTQASIAGNIASMAMVGAGISNKNLLTLSMSYCKSVNGIMMLRNSDGSILVKGTATADANVVITDLFRLDSTRSYILSGCPSGGSITSGYSLVAYDSTTGLYFNDIGFGAIISKSSQISVSIKVKSGTEVSTTFYPMLRLSYITDNTYEPYCENIIDRMHKTASLMAFNTLNYNSLTNVLIDDLLTEDVCPNYKSLIIGTLSSFSDEVLTYVRPNGFYYCINLTDVYLPNVTEIGEFAFTLCSSLTKVTLGALKTLPANIFYSCVKLKTVILDAVSEVGSQSFHNCPELTTIVIKTGTTVPILSTSSRLENSTKLTSIYVPDDLVDDYKANTSWSAYSDCIKAVSTYVE